MLRRRFPSVPVTGFAWSLAAMLFVMSAGAQEQQPDWRTEFEAVCVKTDLAMTLSSEELKGLVARCDRLEGQIAAEAEIVRKVYLRRLKSCRALFVYVLESRGTAATTGGETDPASPKETAPSQTESQSPQGVHEISPAEKLAP